jgi:hypothetical protein
MRRGSILHPCCDTDSVVLSVIPGPGRRTLASSETYLRGGVCGVKISSSNE